MYKCFHSPLPSCFHLKDLNKNNLIRKVVVSEHSQKTKNEKILFSHPEILCTIKIICAQGVWEVLLPYKTHTVLLLGLQKCWKFLYKWIFRAGDWQEEIIPEKKILLFLLWYAPLWWNAKTFLTTLFCWLFLKFRWVNESNSCLVVPALLLLPSPKLDPFLNWGFLV